MKTSRGKEDPFSNITYRLVSVFVKINKSLKEKYFSLTLKEKWHLVFKLFELLTFNKQHRSWLTNHKNKIKKCHKKQFDAKKTNNDWFLKSMFVPKSLTKQK